MKLIYNRYDKYEVDFEYDPNSEDEVLLMLEKQAEITICKDLSITIRGEGFFERDSTPVCVNEIINEKITPYHKHDYCEINFVLKGAVAEYIDGEKYVFHEGDVLIMNPNICHASHPVGNTAAYNILTSDSIIQNVSKLLSANNPTNYLSSLIKNPRYLIFRNTQGTEIWDILISLKDIFCNKEYTVPFKKAKVKNLTEKLLIKLADCNSLSYIAANRDLALNARDTLILKYITEHYNNISLEEVAKHFGYSEQQIRRIVQKNTGLSYSLYLRSYRMTKAKILLESTNLPINKISHSVGFDSPEYFSRRFKTEFNHSPQEHRLLHYKSPK